MVKIVLSPSESVVVEFADIDGSIEVSFNAATSTHEGSITVQTEWEDSSGRVGEIYREDFVTIEPSRLPN